jgi:uncharacterized protein (TIGR02996 family)
LAIGSNLDYRGRGGGSSGGGAMSEREALMRAICDNPDDDTPRLVFADWLDENGEPERAEFIRVQVNRSRSKSGAARDSLDTRLAELLTTNRTAWIAQLPHNPGWVWGDFVRGFVAELSVNFRADLESDPSLAFVATPLVTLTLFEQALGPWIPHLQHIRELRLVDCPITDADALDLCRVAPSSRLARLRIVNQHDRIEMAAVDRLVHDLGINIDFSY